MPTTEPSRCGQVIHGGRPVADVCETTVLQNVLGRVFSPPQSRRFYSSRLAYESGSAVLPLPAPAGAQIEPRVERSPGQFNEEPPELAAGKLYYSIIDRHVTTVPRSSGMPRRCQ